VKMKKRILSALLAGTMIFAVAGCADEGDERPVATTAATTAGGDNNTDGGDAPTTPKTYEYSEISVIVFNRGEPGGSDPADNFYTDWIKQKVLEDLNIGVTFEKVGRHTEKDDIVLLMAAGTAPDLICTYNDNKLIEQFYSQGGIYDLMPIMEPMKARGELNEMFDFLGDFLIYRNKDPVTNELHSIMTRRMDNMRTCAWIRKDWLDTLGLPLPTTTDEFVDALRAFRDRDPGGVGKDKVIPFTMTPDVRWRASTLIESFIPPDLTAKELFTYAVGNEVNVSFPGMKEGVRLLNAMYNEGLVDRNFALYADDEMSDNAVKAGLVGSYIHNWDQPMRNVPGVIKDLNENVPGANFVPVDCFTNPVNGLTRKLSNDDAGMFLFIPKQSTNPEGVLRYLNWLCTFENRLFLQIGEEGVTHEFNDGVLTMLEVTGDKIINSLHNIDYAFVINGVDLGDEVKNGMAKAGSYPSVSPELVGMALNVANTNKWRLPHVSVEGGITSELGISGTLKEKQKEMYVKAITASVADFDKVWDDAFKDFLAEGAQASMDERARKFDGQ